MFDLKVRDWGFASSCSYDTVLRFESSNRWTRLVQGMRNFLLLDQNVITQNLIYLPISFDGKIFQHEGKAFENLRPVLGKHANFCRTDPKRPK